MTFTEDNSCKARPCSPCLRRTVQPVRRVRLADPCWPSEATWDRLRQAVHGRLIKVESPLAACRRAPEGASCTAVFNRLKNPYYIGEQPALTQTSGYLDAWMS